MKKNYKVAISLAVSASSKRAIIFVFDTDLGLICSEMTLSSRFSTVDTPLRHPMTKEPDQRKG